MTWCPDCHRLIGIGCGCNLSFAEKIKTVSIDKKSLTQDDQLWRDYDEKAGGYERRREWAESKI